MDLNTVKEILAKPQDVVILSHRNPDGDAIGSSLALYHYLKKKHHKINIILPSEIPPVFEYLAGIENIDIFDLKPGECKEIVDKASLIFCLDFNALDRIDKLGKNVQESNAVKIMIDHHIDPEPFYDFGISVISASSTAELIYDFITDLGDEALIDIHIAESVFTGLVTDTGSFKFSTNPRTYEIASKLKNIGLDDYSIQNHIFNSLDPKQLKILGHCLANRMELVLSGKAAIMHLTKEDYKQFQIQRGDTEGIINYMLMMKSVVLAAFVMEQPTIIKLSFRSKDQVNVQQMATSHFNGGGHKNAAGGHAYAKLNDVLEKLKRVIPFYLN
jgi:bifunctional oligoribonuclease and PAP phosphatase NrnA